MFASVCRGLLILAGSGSFVLSASAQIVHLHPGPANDGGASGWATILDLRAPHVPVFVTELTTANTGGIAAQFTVEVFTYPGAALGGPVGSGPASSPVGWTSLGVANAMQGGIAGGVSNQIDIPDIYVPAGQTVGVALLFSGVGPRFYGTGSPPYSVYTTGILEVKTGDARSAPFTPNGTYLSSRAMVGNVWFYSVPEPSSTALLALGAGWIAFRRRRR